MKKMTNGKINFMGLMEATEKKKPSQKTLDLYRDVLYPETTQVECQEYIRSVSFNKKYLTKIIAISKKYGISRSAVIRILLENVEV